MGTPESSFVVAEWADAGGGDDPRLLIAPLHVHHRDDEAWYVLSGTLGFRLGDDEIEAHRGGAVLARRGTPHTYWNAGRSRAEYLLVMTPPIADLVEQIHQPGADVGAIFTSHQSEILSDG